MRSFLPLLAAAVTFATTLSADTAVLPIAATTPSIATANPEYSNRSGRQNPLGVVALSDGYLVLWGDGTYLFADQMTIFVSRVGSDGRLIDPTGIPVGIVSATSVTAVKEGDGARLYWTEYDDASSSFRILTRTVSSDGVVSEAATVGSLPPGSPGGYLRADSNGTRTILVFGRFVIVADGSHLVRMTDIGGWGDPSTVAIAGDRALVTWTAAGGVLMYQIVSLDGEILDNPGGSGLANSVNAAASASNGTSVLLAFATPQLIFVKRFDLRAASLSDVATIPAAGQPLVIWNGSRFIVAWMDFGSGSVVGADVTPTGLTTTRVIVRNSGFSNWAAAGENGIIFVDQRGFCFRISCEYDVWYSIVPLDASVPAETSTLVSAAARRQFAASIARVGSKYFAIWSEQPGGLFGAVIDRDGPSVPIHLASEQEVTSAAVVSAGDRALVLTIGNANAPEWYLTGRFFDQNGNETGTSTHVAVGGTAMDLDVASSGSSFLAVWRHLEEVFGVRIGADGQPIDSSPFVIGTQNNGGSGLATAFDGHDFLVTWMQIPVIQPYSHLVAFARVAPAGTVTTIAPFDIPSYSYGLDLACGGGYCLATWTQIVGDPAAPSEIRALLIRNSDFNLGAGSFAIAPAPDSVIESRVAWEGEAFIVTWFRTTSNELRAATVLAASSPAVSPPIKVASPVDAGATAIACIDSNGCAALFGSLVNDRTHGQSSRLFKSFLGKARARGVRRLP